VPTPADSVAPLGHRPSLDGVRAFAVLLVAGVHTRPRLVPAGSFGVDVFFVLSGFLITTLLAEELDRNGRVSIGRFYARRALRLLPALFALLLTVTLWALLVASPQSRHNALREVAAAASYTRNLTWWAQVPGTMLGHTWSLALEEQFYLVWPAVIALCLRARRPARVPTAAFLVGFVAISALRTGHVLGPASLFIGRPDALLLGAALALLRRDHALAWTAPAASSRASIATTATIAGAAVLLAISAWDPADGFFSVAFTVAAVASAALIFGLVSLAERGPARLFAWRPAVALGRMSYGFYLWHLPALRWTDDRLVGRPAPLRIGLGLALGLVATVLSYRLIERPALRWKRRFAPVAEGPGPVSRRAPVTAA
jgi:peptidoglycan/LPS O-acetylase OafA/YrhL